MRECHPDWVRFWELLAQGLCSGQPLLPLLRSLGQNLPPEPMGSVAKTLAVDIGAGSPLSQAMRNQPTVFPQALVSLMEGGEGLGLVDRVVLLVVEATWRCPSCSNVQFPLPKKPG